MATLRGAWSWLRRCRSVWNPDLHLTIVQANVQGGERIALAGARNTFTGTGLEQRAVGGTLDKQIVAVHEPARHPVQFNTQMRANVKVGSGRGAIQKGETGEGHAGRFFRFLFQAKFQELAGNKLARRRDGLPTG